MKALLKNRNRVLAFIMALAMVLTMIPMGIAFADEIVYTVQASKPAIPAQQGKVIDLAKIAVEFENDTYRGTELEWTTDDTTGGVVIGNGIIAVFGSDIYAVEALAPTGEKKTVYLMQTDESGVATIYNHTFTSADILNGTFKADSEWAAQVTNNEALGFFSYFGNGLCLPSDKGNISATYYIKPNSVPGKMISDFSDLTVEYNAFSRGVPGFSGPLLRVNLGDNETYESADASVYPSIVTRNSTEEASWLRIYCSGTKIDGDKDDLLADDTTGDAFHYTREGIWYNVRATLEGTALRLKYTSPTQTATYNVPQAVTVTAGGTVGVKADEIRNASLKDFTVTTTLDISRMEEYFSDEEIYIVKADNAILPMYEGQKLDLTKLFFEFDNGTVAAGSQIAWSINNATDGVKVNNTEKSIIMFSEGFYGVVASYAGQTKTFYVATPDANNQVVIYNKTFSASDFDANGYFTEESEWYSSYNDNKGKFTEKTGAYGLYGNNNYTTIYLRPDSEGGKAVSSFRDITYEVAMRPTDQMNWWGYAAPIARVNATGSINENLTDMTYVATYYSTLHPTSSHTAQNHAASGNCNGVLDTMYEYASVSGKENSKINSGISIPLNATSKYKMVLKGDTYSSYVNAGSGYVETTMELTDAQVTAMASTKAGTIGIYSTMGYRAGIASAKAYVDVAQEAIDAMAARSSDIPLIPANNPVIPMEAKKNFDTSNVYFGLDSGKVVAGSDITWSTTDTTGAIKAEDSVITLFSGNFHEITATYGEETKTFYVVMPNEEGNVVLMDYQFSAADKGVTISDGSYAFLGENNTWKVTSDGGAATSDYIANRGLSLYNNSSFFVLLNPDSPYGKRIANFSDIIIDIRADGKSVPKWANSDSADPDGSIYIYGRFVPTNDMPGSPNNNKDTYVGYRQYFSNAIKGSVVTSKNGSIAGAVLSTYNHSTGDYAIDMRLKLDGTTVTYWAKNGNAAEFGDPLFTVTDSSIPTGTGAVGYYSSSMLRPAVKYVKVAIEVDEKLINTVAAYSSDLLAVSADKPAIPMNVGKKVNVSNIYFEFDSGAVALGKDITWSTTDTTGGVIVADADKTIALVGNVIYPVTATYKGEEKTFYVVTPDADKNVVLYSKDFKQEDVVNSNLTAESEWIVKKDSDAHFIYYYPTEKGISVTSAEVGNASNITAGTFYLNPNSESGKRVSAFRDIHLETNVYLTTRWNQNYSNSFGIMIRLNLGDDGVYAGTDSKIGAYYTAPRGADNATYKYAAVNLSFGSSSSASSAQSYDLNNSASNKIVLAAKGSEVTSSANGNETVLSISNANRDAIALTKSGTIGFRVESNTRSIFQSVKAIVSFTDKELAMFADSSITSDLDVIAADKPAIPMEVNKKAVLSDIFFGFNDGTYVKGANITWSSVEGSSGVVVYGAEKAVTLLKEGIYPIKATYGEHSQVFYVVSYDNNNQSEIYFHEFKEDQVDTATGNFVANSEWVVLQGAGAGNGFGWNSLGGVFTTYPTSTSSYALKPTSEHGKIVSSFRDVIIESNMAFPVDFGGTNTARDFSINGRANWADNSAISGVPSLYAGGGYNGEDAITYDWAVLKAAGAGEVRYNYSSKNTGINKFRTYKVELIGDEIGLYKDGEKAPLSVTDDQRDALSKMSGGTIFIEQYETRVVIKDIKVSISFTDDEIQMIKDTCVDDNSYRISQDKPAIPVQADSTVDLNGILIEMSDGSYKSTADIVWEWGSDDLLYNEEDNTLGIYARGSYPVKAKLNDADEGVTLYFVTPDDVGDYKIYSHNFSANDIADGKFTAESEWYSSNTEQSISANSLGHVGLFTNASSYFVLDPESESGKMVSLFRDIIFETEFSYGFGDGMWNGYTNLFARGAFTDNTYSTLSNYAAMYVSGVFTGDNTHYNYRETAKVYGEISSKASASVSSGYYLNKNAISKYKLELVGDTFKYYMDNGDGYVDLSVALTDDQKVAISSTKAGTIGVYSSNGFRPGLVSAKVSIAFTEEEIKMIKSTPIEFRYVVDTSGAEFDRNDKVFSTMSDAIAYIGAEGGEILVNGAATVANLQSASKVAHKDIVIKGVDGVAENNTLTITDARVALYGNITFENITVVPKTEIVTGKDYSITFGEGSVASGLHTYYKDRGNGTNVIINSPTANLATDWDGVGYLYEANFNFDYNLALNAGSHGAILMGLYANNGATLNGDINVTLNGATVKNVYAGHGGTGIGHDTILRGNSTFIMNGGSVTSGVYIDTMHNSNAGRNIYVHNLTYIFNEKTMNNTVVLVSGNVIKHLRDESKWVVILNNAENSKVSVRDGATDDVDYFISVNGGTAEPVYTGRTSEDAASNELVGFKFKSDSDKTKVFVNNKTIVEPDENGIYDLTIFQGEAINVEFVYEEDVVVSYDEIEDISSYRTDGYKAPTKDGYVFGGWFAFDAETGKFVALTEEEANAATSAHAKFVPEGVLGIAWQLELGTTAATDKADIRFITTIDSFDYRRVEFVMNLGGRDSKPIVSSVGYTTLYGFADGLTRYTPQKTFSPMSTRFIPALITNVPNAVFTNEDENPLYVTASWVTMDGTKVSGEKKQIKFSRALEATPKYDQAVVCWGDSITMGLSMGANQNYPDVLDGLIKDDIKVLNAGVGGENSASILSRANLLPTTVYSTITFAAGQREVALGETAFFKGMNGESLRYVHYVMGNRLSIRKVFIGGQEFEISVIPAISGNCHTFMLRRKGDISEALTLEPGVEVRFDYSDIYTSTYCNVALIGCNDGSSFSLDTLIARYRTIEQSADRFIAIVPFYYADHSAEFEQAFPGQTVDYRAYIRSEDCFNKYGAELGFANLDEFNAAWAEVDAQGAGYVLPKLSQDGNVTNVHLSALGYKIMANLVYAKGVELGYWN